MAGSTPSDSTGDGLRRSRRPIVLGFVALLIGIVALLAFAVFLALEQGNAASEVQEATSVDVATLPQTVPFAWVAGHVVVEALPAGADAPLGFMLDSGAPVLYADDVAARYGGDPVGQIRTAAVDGTIADEEVVVVDRFAIGDAIFGDVAGVVGWVGPDNPLSCVTQDGLLGANLMKNAVWQIDYAAREVTIAPSSEGLDHVHGAIELELTPTTTSSPSPLVELPIGAETLTFLLDTGSDGGLTLHPTDLEAIGLDVDQAGPTLSTNGAGAGGTFITEIVYTQVPLTLGGLEVDYPVATSDTIAEGQGNIGNGFLSAFVVTIDWPGGKVFLDPVAPDGSIAPPPEPAAAGIGWDGERIIIGSIVKGGSAAEAGLELGAAVSSIDGQSYADPSREDFCALLTAEPPAATMPTSTTLTTDDGQAYAIEVIEGFYD